MKPIFLASAAAAAMSLLVAPAMAQDAPLSRAYGTLGYSHLDAGDVGLGTVQGRLGYKFTPNLAVEGEGAIGVDTDEATAGGVTYSAKVKRSVAAYAVGTVPVGEKVELFARAGYGTTKIKGAIPGVAVTGSSDSWNYGGGVQYSFDGLNGVRADYTRHDFRHGRGSADAWGVSYVRRF
jgi:outer membrane immunogenic protein